jgi:hypothetical protein
LKPGGLALIATSHRCFPTKAILAWHTSSPQDRIRFLKLYLDLAGFGPAQLIDRSPPNADPLWVVLARKGA